MIAGFRIPAGTTGDLFHSHVGAVVQWNVSKLNGWNLLSLILQEWVIFEERKRLRVKKPQSFSGVIVI